MNDNNLVLYNRGDDEMDFLTKMIIIMICTGAGLVCFIVVIACIQRRKKKQKYVVVQDYRKYENQINRPGYNPVFNPYPTQFNNGQANPIMNNPVGNMR